jgi:succinyl-diaminopimelate desuccinylase
VSDLAQWIREREPDLVGLLQSLIRARSENPPGNEVEPAAIVMRRLRELGAEIDVLEPAAGRVSVIGKLDAGKAGPTVLCNAHLDTVPAGQGWTVDPFGGARIDGCIYGRGATDHKSPIAALLQAVACLEDLGRFRGRLLLVFDADEEQGGALGMRRILNDRAVKADIAFYACATSYSAAGARFFNLGIDNVFNGSVGLLRLRVTYKSRTAYQVAPIAWWYPAEIATRSAVRLQSSLHSPSWFGPMPRARLRAAAASEQTWDVFVLPEEDPEHLLAMLREWIDSECERAGEATAVVDVMESIPPAFCHPEHPLVQTLVHAAGRATGRTPHVSPVGAVTGMSPIQAKLAVPIAAFGYGCVELDHAPDERITVTDLVSSAIVYAEALAMLGENVC